MYIPRERLRQQLKATDPTLHAALMRNWDIAWQEWLFALDVNLDSFNSYPHIRNVEHYLDELVTAPAGETGDGVSMRVPLSPAEIYVLLAATLVHDVGRTQGKPHGYFSGELVQKSYADFGIPSEKLARTIGRVCAFHDTDSVDYRRGKHAVFDEPKTREVVDPHGGIRERLLAALLFMADHLDSAFTRVMPLYLRPAGVFNVIGAFRRVISGVEVDHDGRMACTVLGEPHEGTAPTAPEEFCRYTRNEDCLDDKFMPENPQTKQTDLQLQDAMVAALKMEPLAKPVTINKAFLDWLLHNLGAVGDLPEPGPARPKDWALKNLPERVPLLEEMTGREGCGFSPAEWLLARRMANLQLEEENQKPTGAGTGHAPSPKPKPLWPPVKIVAIVMADVLKNAQALVRVRSDLAAMGLPLRAWLIESHERLFNLWGEQTYEPVFTLDYLEKVATKMWDLSTRIFGQSLFTYQNLADELREMDVGKVKRAVHRIAIVTRPRHLKGNEVPDCSKAGEETRDAIEARNRRWQWVAGEAGAPDTGRMCKTRTLKEVRAKLQELGDPV
ncbi:MAG: hypothetical protein NTX87_09610 [Planctomycetota bacterium]|nr:hypothetical protein [Planctomycetota bacterium]